MPRDMEPANSRNATATPDAESRDIESRRRAMARLLARAALRAARTNHGPEPTGRARAPPRSQKSDREERSGPGGPGRFHPPPFHTKDKRNGKE